MAQEQKQLLDYVKDYIVDNQAALTDLIYYRDEEVYNKEYKKYITVQLISYRDKALNEMYWKYRDKYSNAIDVEEIEAIFLEGVYKAFEEISTKDMNKYTADSVLGFFNRTIKGLLLTELQKKQGYIQLGKKETNEYYNELENRLLDPNIGETERHQIFYELDNRKTKKSIKKVHIHNNQFDDDVPDEEDHLKDNSYPIFEKMFSDFMEVESDTTYLELFLKTINIKDLFNNAPVQYKVLQKMIEVYDENNKYHFNQKEIVRLLGRSENSNVSQEVKAVVKKLSDSYEVFYDYMVGKPRNLTQRILDFIREYEMIHKFDKTKTYDYFYFTYDFLKRNYISGEQIAKWEQLHKNKRQHTYSIMDILCDSKYMNKKVWTRLHKMLEDKSFDGSGNTYKWNNKTYYLKESLNDKSNMVKHVLDAFYEYIKVNERNIYNFLELKQKKKEFSQSAEKAKAN